MNELTKLQNQYKAGKIKKEEYLNQLKELLDSKEISQEDYDEAKDYDPEGDKPIYTQADVDGMIARKASAMVRKALKDQGVTLDVPNSQLLAKVAEMAKAGDGKGATDDKEVAELRKKAARFDEAEPKLKALTLENAVLKAAGKYNPHNPAQVVRALNVDYADLIEYDDEGAIIGKSVERAIKKVAESEPNLFKAAESGEDDDTDDNQKGFKGKAPGGNGGGKPSAAKEEARLKEMRELMGIPNDKK